LAQGLLVNTSADKQVRLPRPGVPSETTYQIEKLDVHVRLMDRVARVQVSQTFKNTGSLPLEAAFVFPLPYDGAIDRLTLLIDGKEQPARLLPADEARRLYEAIVRKNRDPALLEWMGTGMYKTSVFPLPPGATRTVTLRYTQICRMDRGMIDFLFPLSTAKYTAGPLGELTLDVSIEASQPIKNVYSPTYSLDIDRPDARHATMKYMGNHILPQGDFRLMFDVGAGALGTSVLSYRPEAEEDGYLLLLASPSIEAADAATVGKTIVFVVDRSGSMSGKKIEQAKGALKFVLNHLHEDDLFNIVAYDSEVESFRDELQRYGKQTRAAALAFVDGLVAGGSTNIDAALQTAMAQLSDTSRPSYVVFLIDCLPTVGQRSEAKIVDAARKANQVRARLFAFGVGYDVNSRLLDKLVRANFGRSQYVRPEENIEDRVSRLYREIQSPALTGVTVEFQFDEDESEESPARPEAVYRVYPRGDFDLFQGEQIVIAARYRRAGSAKIIIRGRLGAEEKTYEFAAELAAHSKDDRLAFVEKIWATRRIGEIIDEIDLHGENDELVHELVELSTRHGILTSYTSFLADDGTDLSAVNDNARRARGNLKSLEMAAGAGGFAQRQSKARLQSEAQAPAAASYRDEKDQVVQIQTVRHAGGKTFYRRKGRWVDSAVPDKPRQTVTQIAQFSDAYFALAKKYGPRAARYLAFDEPVVFSLDGQIFRVEPPRR